MSAEELLRLSLTALGLPEPCPEYRFSERKFRFDFAYPEAKVAIEIEGQGPKGLGRHQRPEGFERDLEKYNLAVVLGWRILRFTPSMIRRDPVGCANLVAKVLE